MPKKKKRLSIRITYEPNRLSKGHLTMAYEILIPKIKFSLARNALDDHSSGHEILLNQVGGKSI